jgi:hypothetical protein
MRIELRDGQWADLRERITHAQDKAIKKAYAKGLTEPDAKYDFDTVIAREFARAWDVNDPDGKPIPLTDEDAIDRAPDDVVERIVEEATPLWTGATVPNQAYAKLIGRLILGQRVGEAEVNALPDPEAFKDALLLASHGSWSPKDLDEMDALLLALVQKIRNAKRG